MSCCMSSIIPKGIDNTDAQYTCIEEITELHSCNLPANDKDLFFQSLIQFLAFITRILQSRLRSRDDIRGTPRYFTGRVPSEKGITFGMLGTRLDTSLNSFRESMTTLADSTSPHAKMN
ncbi:hypothetical protein Tco_1158010, partial [Tanacetum coccineum]